MKSLIVLFQSLVQELGEWYRISTIRDQKTILDRFNHEGLSFVSITLPQFCKDFERSLDQGFVDPSLFQAFKKRGELPVFLGGFLDQVIDRETGVLLDEPSWESIYAIRQVCLFFGKVELDCTEERIQAAFDKFIESNEDMKSVDIRLLQSYNDGGEVESFLDSALCFGLMFLPISTDRSLKVTSFQNTDRVPLRKELLETRSSFRRNGLAGLTYIFLVGNIYFQTGGSTKNSSPFIFFGPELRYPLG